MSKAATLTSITELISLTCYGQGLAVHAKAEVTRSWLFSLLFWIFFSGDRHWVILRRILLHLYLPQNVGSQALSDHSSGLESFLLHCNLPGGSWRLCSVSLWLECLLHHSWQKEGECEQTVERTREGGKNGEGALYKFLWINDARASGAKCGLRFVKYSNVVTQLYLI